MYQWNCQNSVIPISGVKLQPWTLQWDVTLYWQWTVLHTIMLRVRPSEMIYGPPVQAQVPICGWLMVIPWCVTLLGCRGWLLRCSNYFLYGDIGLFRTLRMMLTCCLLCCDWPTYDNSFTTFLDDWIKHLHRLLHVTEVLCTILD